MIQISIAVDIVTAMNDHDIIDYWFIVIMLYGSYMMSRPNPTVYNDDNAAWLHSMLQNCISFG